MSYLQNAVTTIKKYPASFIFFSSLLLFVIIQSLTVNALEEDRFIFFVSEMMHRGITFFPYVDNAPYPDYISTSTIFSYFFSWLSGYVSVLSVGLPYSITAALIVVFTYKIGALHDQFYGALAAFFLLLSWKFVNGVSAYDLDLYPALATAICIYLCHYSRMTKTPIQYNWLNILWIFGYFTRGPMGLLIPAVMTITYYLADREWKTVIRLSTYFMLWFLLGWLLLAYKAYEVGGYSFMQDVLNKQGLGRVFNVDEHAPRYYFFFTLGLLDYSLTSIIALIVIISQRKKLFRLQTTNHKQKLLSFCVQWLAIIILLFTIPATKKARYIMPIMPAIALLSAYPWLDGKCAQVKRAIIKLLYCVPWVGLVAAIGAVIVSSFTEKYKLQYLIQLLLMIPLILFMRKAKKSKNSFYWILTVCLLSFGATDILMI